MEVFVPNRNTDQSRIVGAQLTSIVEHRENMDGGLGDAHRGLPFNPLESATFGPTPLGGGPSIISAQFSGARFSLATTFEVSAVGGALQSSGAPGDIFAAVVRLGPSGLPQGLPFNTGEVLASTIFNPGTPGSDLLVPLSVSLPPGDYGLVVGTGLFGASGEAFVDNKGTNLPGASYFRWVFGTRWDAEDASAFSYRLVVRGSQKHAENNPGRVHDHGISERDFVNMSPQRTLNGGGNVFGSGKVVFPDRLKGTFQSTT